MQERTRVRGKNRLRVGGVYIYFVEGRPRSRCTELFKDESGGERGGAQTVLSEF